MVEWSCTNKKIKLMRTLIFGRMVVYKWNKLINEDPNFWSNGRVQIKEINQWRPQVLVEWSCTKERLNERGPYILVEWSCANKRNKSVATLNSGRMVVHIASAKIKKRE